jgi:hypothetical protein
MEKRVTYHEAGHVVANLVLGLPFEYVTVKQERKEGKQAENGKWVDMEYLVTEGVALSEEELDRVNDQITSGLLDLRFGISAMAGPQAEANLVGDIDEVVKEAAQSDMQGMRVACRFAVSPRGCPLEQLQHSEIEDFIIPVLAEQADKLLQDNWAAVEAISKALNTRKTLSYAEAAKIFQSVPVVESPGAPSGTRPGGAHYEEDSGKERPLEDFGAE